MTTPKYNLKNPGVKRIMQEAKELARESTYEYSAHPLEDNLFEWHFTVRGPKDTEFENGRYHGRILLPNEYPFKPPEIIFLTPNGRFELNKKICLSITGFHPEFWQPAWGIRTVLLAVVGFFPTEAKGAIGGLDYTKEERRKLAKKSLDWSCSVCEIHLRDALSDTPPDETAVKEELPAFMISYRKDTPEDTCSTSAKSVKETDSTTSHNSSSNIEDISFEKLNNTGSEKTESAVDLKSEKVLEGTSSEDNVSTHTDSRVTTNEKASGHSQQFVTPVNPRVIPMEQQHQQQQSRASNGAPVWLDALIAGLVSFLVVLICRRYVF